MNSPARSGIDARPLACRISPEKILPILKQFDRQFDPALSMIRGVASDIRYHSKIRQGTTVHITRDTAEYAFALLECGEAEQIIRASTILDQLITLQDQCPTSPTYGIWSWFYEEPLDKMSPPDWNWADFIGTQLVQILWRNAQKIEVSLRDKISAAIRHAALSIIRRDVTMAYTNIAIMGTYVTVLAGAILGDKEILDYGKKRLRRFAAFTKEWGGFQEYNSPTYTVVALTDLSRMLRDFTDDEDLAIARKIHDQAWKGIALHWHTRSRQWAGPHSRSYQTLLSPNTLDFIQQGLGQRVVLTANPPPSLNESTLPIQCPERYARYFLEETAPRTERLKISAGSPDLYGTTYLAKAFALSSEEHGTFWNQARSLVAYAANRSGATALQLRFIKDGYDYSSAKLLASQNEGRILAGICFASDGGDLHCNLDRIQDATVEASDWRLRIELHGQLEVPQLPKSFSTETPITFALGDGATVAIRIPWVEFGGVEPRWEVTQENGKTGLDLVLYHGAPRRFIFDNNFPCGMGFALSMGESEPTHLAAVRFNISENRLELQWPLGNKPTLSTALPRRPLTEEQIIAFTRKSIGTRAPAE